MAMPRDDAPDYAQRLQIALKRSPKPISTAADLAREFNLRHERDPVTPQAAQKWLTGKAKPRYEKSVTLATWLGVSVGWLHSGLIDTSWQDNPTKENNAIELKQPETLLINRFRSLTRHQQELVAAVIEEFVSINLTYGGHTPQIPQNE